MRVSSRPVTFSLPSLGPILWWRSEVCMRTPEAAEHDRKTHFFFPFALSGGSSTSMLSTSSLSSPLAACSFSF